ncbi:MAG: hypothetical protein GY722_24990, partial [bacterium]|nr:hypothetical protein [bacterium]
MTRIRRLAAHAGFSVLLSLMLIEMIGLVDFFIKTQELYYFSPPAIEVFPDKRKWEHSVEAHRLHPYFGFVARPSVVISDEGRETHLNNYGFYSLVDY